jgi:hypothetical protein
MNRLFTAFLLSFLSLPVFADWAMVPELQSHTLWQLVAENRAEVVSSVGFGSPDERHEKQTVFRILDAKKSEGDISWAINPDGSYRPVMCTEKWKGPYTYLGSTCEIPGCTPDNEKCLKRITKNL